MHIPRSRALGAVSLTAAAVLLLSGCTGAAGTASGDDTKLTLGTTTDINGWSPLDQPQFQNWAIDAVYSPLVQCDKFGKAEPGIADTFEISPDNTVFTAHIREGATFSDGSPVDAQAIVDNFELAGTAGGSIDIFKDVVAEATDEQNVTVTWPEPQPIMGERICNMNIGGSDYIASGDLDSAPVGYGPYFLDADASTPGATYVFTKNADFWDADTYPYETLELRVLESETAGVNALKTGQIDGTLVSTTARAEVEAAGLEIQTMSAQTTRLMLSDYLGTRIPALASLDVRRAMNMVFDKEAIAENLYGGYATPAVQMFRPGSDAYIDDLEDPYPYDVEAAQALMEGSGFADGFTVTLPYMAGDNLAQVIPYVKQQLALLNITVEEQTLSGPDAIQSLLNDFPVVLWNLGNSGDSVSDIDTAVMKDGFWNLSHHEDPVTNALWQTILTGSGEERVEAQQEINRYIIDQAWFAPLVNPETFFGHSDKVTIDEVTDNQGLYPLLRDFS